ncbi:MAG: Putative metal chaperone, involved in Zn homeostasis, GTPase of COG0523 family [uncultured Thiotrichaceae bacterium]|uniref:Metal chaperone, involved in Zn homeostasis, GTPase of COG0523 family n=1 Tax=uncultured Thiotrichaceae bacterium TaxID=298394 RepID=A0A6S6U112_9GAMM|nr:MAG: Putative metal chaperone, involved in Zn homeostasis, GTPase of COG0523 family [uncultured Thiotrichaceae bacterium]
MKTILRPIPTNIITGFLGVGKTTTILELLKHKPKEQKWAVLVNEFGEIGIDGELLNTQSGNQEQITIKEVAGGCMCCAAGVSTQVALNQLIKEARPDRLIIEPTGLGHPKEIINTIQQDVYKGILDYQNTITLLDPRHSNDERYTTHSIYQQQLDVADIFIANKSDLSSENEIQSLQEVLSKRGLSKVPLIETQQGVIDITLLDQPAQPRTNEANDNPLNIFSVLLDPTINANHEGDGFLRKHHQQQAFSSIGWVFNTDTCFDYFDLTAHLSGLNIQRLKAIMRTDRGVYTFNYSGDILSSQLIEDAADSRLEIISDDMTFDADSFEQTLLSSRITQA